MSNQHKEREGPLRLVEASRARVAQAYYTWLSHKGRAKRGSNVDSAELFTKAIRAMLDVSRDAAPERLGIPNTRQGHANWKAGRCNPIVRIRYDVCLAIFSLTRVDATENGFLSHTVVNSTDLVTMKGISLEKLTDRNALALCIQSIEFHRSAPKAIVKGDATGVLNSADAKTRIGSVTYSLREASISTIGGDSLRQTMVRLSHGNPSKFGRSDGAEVFPDGIEPLRWRIQPTHPKVILQATLENIRPCVTSFQPEAETVVRISVSRTDVDPLIDLDNAADNLKLRTDKMRERLVQQILRNRIPDQGVRERFILSSGKAGPNEHD